MRRPTKVLAVFGALALLIANAPTLAAQGAGSASKQSVTAQRGQRGQSGKASSPGQMSQQGRLSEQMTPQQRQLIRADEQQARGVRDCTGVAAGVRTRARELARQAGSSGLSREQAAGAGAQLGDRVQTMFRRHDHLMEGLGGQQQYWLRDQVRDLEQTRSRIRDRLDDFNAELGAERPDPKLISSRAADFDREMEKWQQQYLQLGADLGVELDKEEGR